MTEKRYCAEQQQNQRAGAENVMKLKAELDTLKVLLN